MGGNFNKICRTSKKFGRLPVNQARDNRFSQCLNYCRMIDLGFAGSKFTWSNFRRNNKTILEMLDRVTANSGWIYFQKRG